MTTARPQVPCCIDQCAVHYPTLPDPECDSQLSRLSMTAPFYCRTPHPWTFKHNRKHNFILGFQYEWSRKGGSSWKCVDATTRSIENHASVLFTIPRYNAFNMSRKHQSIKCLCGQQKPISAISLSKFKD